MRILLLMIIASATYGASSAHATTYLDSRSQFPANSTPAQDLNVVNPTDGGTSQDSSIRIGTILADIPIFKDYYLNFSAPFPNACTTIVNNLQPSGTSFFNIAYFASEGGAFIGHDDVVNNDIRTLFDGTCAAHFRALNMRSAGTIAVLQVRQFSGGYLIPSFPLVMTSGGIWTGPLAPYCGLHCRYYNETLYARLSDTPFEGLSTTYFDFRTSTGTAISNHGDGTLCSAGEIICKYIVINLGRPSAPIAGIKYYQLNMAAFNIMGNGCSSGALDIAVYNDAAYTSFDHAFSLDGSGSSPSFFSASTNFSVSSDKFAQLIFGCNDGGGTAVTLIDGGPGTYVARDINSIRYTGLPNLCVGDTPADCGATINTTEKIFDFENQSGSIGTDLGNGPLGLNVRLGQPRISVGPGTLQVQFFQTGTGGCGDPGYSFQAFADRAYTIPVGTAFGLLTTANAAGSPIALGDYNGIVNATIFGAFDANKYYTFGFGSCDFSRPISIKGDASGTYTCTQFGGLFGVFCYTAYYQGASPYLIVSPVTPPTGTITVTTNIPAATFTITDGSGNIFSGSDISTTLQNVPIGTYTITFGSASGYITPPQQTQTLLAGGTLRFSANYVPILLQMSPSTIFFNYQAGTTTAPPSQPLSVTTSTNTSVPTIISTNTTPVGGTWFSITSNSDTTPSMLTVSVVTGLDPGTYSGTVTVTSSGILNGPQTIPIMLQVTTPGGPFSSTDTWRKLNGSWNSDCDGSFGAIAVDPGNRDTVYVGSSRSSEPCGLYKSANSGKTWTAINTGFPQFGIFPFQQYPSVSKIAIAPSDHSVIYVGTIFGDGASGRILRSDNAGRIWTDASGQLTNGIFAPTINAPVLDISISPTNASIVFAGLSKAGVFKTQDSGKDWTLVRGGALVEGETDNFYVVRFAQSNLSMAYGAGFTAFSGSLPPCVISEGGAGDCVDFKGAIPFPPFMLTDENGGTLFSSLLYPTTILGLGPLITDLAIDPSDSNTVYASTIAYPALSIEIIPAPVPNLGVFETQDGGLHWKPVNGSSDLDVSQFPLFRLVMDPIDPHTLYAVAGASGIFVTTNGGENWKRVSMNGLPTGTFMGNLALGNNRRLYALTSNGVYVLGN